MSVPPNPRDEAEIVVVGGGPTGSTTAAVLAELGHDVLIIDKDEFPREKACGDGLMHPAVAAAERMGLNDLIESSREIDGVRLVLGHRRQTVSRFASAPGRPQPRCIKRKDFDAALLDSARDRGARFLHARVDGLQKDDGDKPVLAVVAGEEPFTVRGGTVIAADGATSRIRRETTSAPSRPTAYAVRQYFVSEKPLEPIFEGYLPLEVEGQVLPGYGWVFPTDLHTANVGVGIFGDMDRCPPLTRVLKAFVEELQTKAAHRFGDLKATGEPFGSPIGIRSPIEVSSVPGIVLAGDAAGTTHAITGEGIPFAMRGGEALGRAVHARLKKGNRSQLGGPDDAALWQSFPQLGIDTSVMTRIWNIEMNKASFESIGSVSEPFLGIAKRMQVESVYDTGAQGTPAWSVLDAFNPALGECLERANDTLLESLSNQMPFVAEVVHHSIRSHLGPMYAAVTLATASKDGAVPPDKVLDAAVAAETVAVLPELLTMLVDRARSKSLRVNNAFAILAADFAATRALGAAAKLGAPAAAALALASQRGCEGGMRDASNRFATDRTVESWFQAASETAGSAMVFATQLGAIVRGEDRGTAETLRQFAIELGTAMRLAEEIVDLTAGEEMHPGREGADLRRGIYPLPVLYAIEADPHLSRMLARHTAENGDPAEIISTVRDCGALDRALVECSERGEAARSLAESLPGGDGDLLVALAGAPADYVASRAVTGDAGDALSTPAS